MSTYVSIRRAEPGLYAVEADVDVRIDLAAAKVEMSTERITWAAAPGVAKGNGYEVRLPADTFASGPAYLRLR